jgi:hypothetical protein
MSTLMSKIAGNNPANPMVCLDNHKKTTNESKIEKTKNQTAAGSIKDLLKNFSTKTIGVNSNPFKLALLREMNKSKVSIQDMF